MDKLFFCSTCYKNHKNPFMSGLIKEMLGNYCHTCNNHNLTEMSLTYEEYEIIEHLPSDKIILIDNFKKEELNTLSDEEFLKILNVNSDIDFISAMNELKNKDIIDFNLKLSQMSPTKMIKEDSIDISYLLKDASSNIPKCPTCGSSNIKKISATKRWVGVGMFGLASSDVGKTMQCEDCGYKW